MIDIKLYNFYFIIYNILESIGFIIIYIYRYAYTFLIYGIIYHLITIQINLSKSVGPLIIINGKWQWKHCHILSQCCLEIVNLNWCFAEILQGLHIELSPPEFEQLAVKYDIKNSGRLSYPDFLRHFVLMFSPQVNTSSNRLKLQLPTTPVSTNDSTSWVVIGQYSSCSIFWPPPSDESRST